MKCPKCGHEFEEEFEEVKKRILRSQVLKGLYDVKK